MGVYIHYGDYYFKKGIEITESRARGRSSNQMPAEVRKMRAVVCERRVGEGAAEPTAAMWARAPLPGLQMQQKPEI